MFKGSRTVQKKEGDRYPSFGLVLHICLIREYIVFFYWMENIFPLTP